MLPKPLLRLVVLAAWAAASPTWADAEPAPAPASQAKPPGVEQLRASARKAMAAQEWGRAVDLWSALLAAKPDDETALNDRGLAYAELGQFEVGLADGQRAVEIAPKSAGAWNSLCWIRILADQAAQARPACEKAVQLDPGEMASTVNLGHTYLLAGDRQGAWAWYEKTVPLVKSEDALKQGPLNDFDIFVRKGWQMELSREGHAWFMAKGKAWLERKAPLDELSRQAHAAVRAGDYRKAADLWERSLPLVANLYGDMDRRFASALDHLAGLYQDMGQYGRAEPLYVRALDIIERALGPEHPDTGTRLNYLAGLYQAMGQYAPAEPLYVRALDIIERALGPEHPDTGTSLNNLAGLYQAMNKYARAEPLYARALAIHEKTLGPEHASTAVSLNNLATLYEITGQYVLAEPLFARALAIAEKAIGPEHPDTGTRLNNLGVLYENMGQYARAEPLYVRALDISEKALGPEHPSTALSLNNLAGLYRAMGQYARAEPLYAHALAIFEKARGREHPDTGASLSNLAILYEAMGQYARAEPLLLRALAIAEETVGPEHPSTAVSLNNLAALYEITGQYVLAEPLFARALAIHEKTLGPEHASTAVSLNNLATLYQTTGRYARAVPLFLRAMAIHEKAFGPQHPSTALSFDNLAMLYGAMDQYSHAETLYVVALAIREKALGPEHPATGSSLNKLAGLYRDMGRRKDAQPLYERAYRIALNAGDPRLAWTVQGNLSYFHAKTAPPLAIFYGKQAVNTLQVVRGNLKDTDKATQKSFLGTVEGTYQRLADLLIGQGRLPEAQQVLKMLKEDEYRDFIRRSQDAQAHSSLIAYTGAERPWAEEGDAIAQEGIRLAAAIKPLEQAKGRGLSGEEDKQLSQLLVAKQALGKRFDHWFNGIAKDFPAAGERLAEESRRAQEAALAEARAQVARQGQHAALVEYLMVGDRLHILLTTPKRSLARQVHIDGKAIYRKLVDFRQVLESPGSGGSGSDPRILGKELYDSLFAPIAGDLQADETRTVMLSLEGALRYVPFSALYDGQHYLIERYALPMHTTAGKRHEAKARGPLKVAALGTTLAYEGFKALPGVKREMDLLFKEGQLVGDVYLDRRFTADQLNRSLSKRYPVLHVASHFQFTPGNEADSFLLLGDGSRLSLMELREGNYPFQDLDLLTLSACMTAMHGGREANGREVEGFGALAQNKGAGAVLATLWSIADASTPDLMKAFYQQRAKGVDKAEALRQAQLALLSGQVGRSETSASRGERKVIQAANAFSPDPKAPFAHPYYWAPFILMGNWL